MTKKIIFAGACTLALVTALYICSELALAERGYSAVGGEIIGIAFLAFVFWAGAKTIKEIKEKSLPKIGQARKNILIKK